MPDPALRSFHYCGSCPNCGVNDVDYPGDEGPPKKGFKVEYCGPEARTEQCSGHDGASHTMKQWLLGSKRYWDRVLLEEPKCFVRPEDDLEYHFHTECLECSYKWVSWFDKRDTLHPNRRMRKE